MKKITSILLAGIMASQMLVAGTTVSSAEAYYNICQTLDGEESRTVTNIYDGVTRTDFVLSTSSKYSNHGAPQRFTTIEFDPSQDDLYVECSGGGDYLHNKRTTSKTVTAYNEENESEGKKALVATNGDLWLMNNYDVRVEGKENNYVDGYDSYPANATIGYNLPSNFTMYDGEIVCTSRMPQEEPFPGIGWTFGISSDGEALFGEISSSISVTNQTKSTTAEAHGINRIPANNALVVYTDKGFASNFSLYDAYEVIIDCGYDYTFRAGETITGTVTAITKPGEDKYSITANRVILTARGDQIQYLKGYSVGDEVSIKVDISDSQGNTKKWLTVTNCVSGHFPHVMNGVVANYGSSQNINYPATIIGKKANGNVVMLTSWGRQIKSGYSEGLWIGEMPQLLDEMGIVSAIMLDGGGSATMVAETVTGGYELTGRPSDSGNTERAVINSIILAVGPSKSGIDDTDITFDSDDTDILVREPENVTYTSENGVVSLTATDYANPNVKIDLFGSSADTYKYMVIEGMPTQTDGNTFTLGIYPTGGTTMDPVIKTGIKTTFDCDGTWQRKVIDLSSLTEWSGRMNYIRLDLFDDTGIGISGEGINLTRIKLFKTLAAANAYAKTGTYGDIAGDADGDGSVSIQDALLVLKKIAKWDVTVKDGADYNRDGTLNLFDALSILRYIAG